jgi:hypothetical protein
MGRNGPIPWLPRSPDLNPLDFYFWGTFNPEPAHVNELWNRLQVAADTIRNNPENFQSIKNSFIRGVRTCFLQNGTNFEHVFLCFIFLRIVKL